MKANSFSKSPIHDISNQSISNNSKISGSNNKPKISKNIKVKPDDKKIPIKTNLINPKPSNDILANNKKSNNPTLNLKSSHDINTLENKESLKEKEIIRFTQEKDIIRSIDSIENLNSEMLSIPEERTETVNKITNDEMLIERGSLIPQMNKEIYTIPAEENPHIKLNYLEEENKNYDKRTSEPFNEKNHNKLNVNYNSKNNLEPVQTNLTVLSDQGEIVNSNLIDINSKDDSKLKEDNENFLCIKRNKIDSSRVHPRDEKGNEIKQNLILIEKNESNTLKNINKLQDTKENDTSDILIKKKEQVNSASGITETKDMNTQMNDNLTYINNNTHTFHQEHNTNQIIQEENYLHNNDNFLIEGSHNNFEDNFKENVDVQSEKIEIQYINFKNDENSMEEEEINSANNGIREKCSKIFHNFAQFSTEDNSFLISKQVLVKLLKITGLIEEKIIRYADLDLLIVKVCGTGKKLNLKQFNNFVIKLAEFIDPKNFKNNPRNTSINLINTLFDPFIEFIQKKFELNDNTTLQWNAYITETLESLIYNFDVSFHISSLLKDLYNSLKTIYCAYFESELNGINLLENSFNHYLIFCKDFEIFPYLLNMNQIAIYWKIVNSPAVKGYKIFDDRKETGKLFTLNKFTMMILHFSLLCFNKLNENFYKNFNNQEKLLFFLEKLQNSTGYNNYETRTNKRLRVSLIPKKETIKIILPSLSSMSFSDFLEDNKDSMPMSVVLSPKKIKEFNESVKKNKKLDFKQILVSGDIIKEILNDKSELLKELFDRYSNIGDKLSMNKMNLTGFLNFLKDCNLIHINQINTNSSTSINMFSTRSVSPIKSVSNNFNLFSTNNSSSISLKKNVNKVQNNLINGKLLESDATILFNNLTGNKNFDNSTSIKRQFDKNKGYSMNLNDSHKISKISHNKSLSTSKVNSISKMDFNLFVKSFEVIAKKLYPDKDINEAIYIFLENVYNDYKKDIGKLLTNRNERQTSEKNKVLEILQNIRNDEIINLIREFHDPIFFHYQNYSENEYMGFGNFLNFFKDFDLFPSIISIVQIKAIFLELAEIFSIHLKNNIKILKSRNKEFENRTVYNPLSDIHTSNLYKNQDIINYDLFLDSLAISAYFMKYTDQYTHCEKVNLFLEKILLLIERMSMSKGILISQKRSGKTFNSFKELKTSFNLVKNKYPEFLAKKYNQTSKDKNETDFSFIFQKRD